MIGSIWPLNPWDYLSDVENPFRDLPSLEPTESLPDAENPFRGLPSLAPERFGSLDYVGNPLRWYPLYEELPPLGERVVINQTSKATGTKILRVTVLREQEVARPRRAPERVVTAKAPTLFEFAQCYSLTLSSRISYLAQANIFLLAEVHWEESSWRKLNSRLISYLSGMYPLVVFAEGYRAMEEITDQRVIAAIRKEYQIDSQVSNIRFFGWDSVELHSEIQPLVYKMQRILVPEIKRLRGLIKDRNEMFERLLPGSSTMDSDALKAVEDKIPSLQVRERDRAQMRLKELEDELEAAEALHLPLFIKSYPARTEGMASSLRYVEKLMGIFKKNTKYIFMAGAHHLRLKETRAEKELDLTPVAEELNLHKVVVMIPNIHDPSQI